MYRGIAWWRGVAGWARAWVAVTAGAVAVLGVLAGAPLRAAGETGTPGGSGGTTCPASNPPNQLTLVAGTPQTAQVGTAFATGLQVALANSDGCPVTGAAGIPVTFAAPGGGASGVFSTSASGTVVVGADASGAVAAPPFTANALAGGFTVTASSQYGSVSFSLTNTVAGIPARLVAIPPGSRSARVTSRYRQPLQVRVLDGAGDPVAGAAVTFTLGVGEPSACAASAGAGSAAAGASFVGGGATATATSGADGVAGSPPFAANGAVGSFAATAAVAGRGAAAGSGREGAGASGGAAAPVSFTLSNLAGRPAELAPGVGATQAAVAGTAFAIPLAVTVTDALKNPVAGALITFSAPAAGASGRFTVRAHGPHRGARASRPRTAHPRAVEVRTDACGIAVAPSFTAGDTPGGYVVKASAGHARPAAFALVNVAAGRSS
ncbi:MAG TPA: hypothetical protein VGY13_13120 [Solirubrobacteraceae bacterium]|jgi:hypothetical protein|nr:hypothetical protein [Solirubrobacteraceae bacterium]